MKTIQKTQLNNLKKINRVVDYVEQNLENDLSLEVLAKVAGISLFHFHRIFGVVFHETLNTFVTRKRIEKIASKLIREKDISIKELSLKYGFNNPTTFSRSFKNFYGITATEMRNKSNGTFNKITIEKSKIRKQEISIKKYIYNIDKVREWMGLRGDVSERVLKRQIVAHIRNRGSFENVINCFVKLKKWAESIGSLNKDDVKWLMVIHDSPAITQESKMLQSACIQLKNKIVLSDDVGEMIIPNGNFLVGRFELLDHEFKNAWDAMSVWMMDHNYKGRDGHYFELFHTDSLFQKNEKHHVDICIPIK